MLLTGVVAAISHPISAVDFALAEEADAVLGARVSAFPELFAARVGHAPGGQKIAVFEVK